MRQAIIKLHKALAPICAIVNFVSCHRDPGEMVDFDIILMAEERFLNDVRCKSCKVKEAVELYLKLVKDGF